MKPDPGCIEEAMEFVSAGTGDALICKKTGRVYLQSDYGDADPDYPEDPNSGDFIEPPFKNDLDLGTRMVFDFVREFIPEHYDAVEAIFSSKGAYRRFRFFLEDKEAIQSWYDYSQKRTDEAICEWCEQNGVNLPMKKQATE